MIKNNMIESKTMFCGCYKSTASATRAMKRWVGSQIEVSFPGVSERFETTTILRADMMEVTRLQGGWGVAIEVTRADLLCVIMGENGEPMDVPYPQVAHWDDATHPAVLTSRGLFRVRFSSVEEARSAGCAHWFTTSSGVLIFGDGRSACAVSAPVSALLHRAA